MDPHLLILNSVHIETSADWQFLSRINYPSRVQDSSNFNLSGHIMTQRLISLSTLPSLSARRRFTLELFSPRI